MENQNVKHEVLHRQAREIVYKVYQYFLKEARESQCPTCSSLNSVAMCQARTAAACGVELHTVQKIISEGRIILKNSGSVSSPGKRRIRHTVTYMADFNKNVRNTDFDELPGAEQIIDLKHEGASETPEGEHSNLTPVKAETRGQIKEFKQEREETQDLFPKPELVFLPSVKIEPNSDDEYLIHERNDEPVVMETTSVYCVNGGETQTDDNDPFISGCVEDRNVTLQCCTYCSKECEKYICPCQDKITVDLKKSDEVQNDDKCECKKNGDKMYNKCSNINSHMENVYETAKAETKSQCMNCKGSFSHTVLPNSHQEENQFECPICGKFFTRRSYLSTHARTHTGEKPYKCTSCGRGFSQRIHLTKHERIHSGEKPFDCEECGKSFIRRGYLVKHMRTHTGERPYQCHVCGRAFTQRNHLTKHSGIHTLRNKRNSKGT